MSVLESQKASGRLIGGRAPHAKPDPSLPERRNLGRAARATRNLQGELIFGGVTMPLAMRRRICASSSSKGPSGDQPGNGLIPVQDQHFFAVLDEFDVGAEFGLQFADLGGSHRCTISQHDQLSHVGTDDALLRPAEASRTGRSAPLVVPPLAPAEGALKVHKLLLLPGHKIHAEHVEPYLRGDSLG